MVYRLRAVRAARTIAGMSQTDPARATSRRRATIRSRLLLAAGATLATLALLEGALWALHPLPATPPQRAHKYLPSCSTWGAGPKTVRHDPGPLAGVTPGLVEDTINSLGFLYPEERRSRTSASELRIAVVGGSTVECGMLAADRRWPAVLEQLLAAALSRPVTVLNLGISAQDTRTHVATTCQLVTHLEVDVCVFMIGTNDLGLATATGDPMGGSDCFYAPPKLSAALRDLLQQTQIGRHLAHLRGGAPERRSTPYYEEAAAFQASLPLRPEAPRATPAGLAHFARNVVTLAGICKEHGIAVLFTTQPSMFPPSPSPEELRAFWGCHDGRYRIPAEQFVALLTSVNEHLLATCASHGYPCADLARQVPKGLGWFYDQVHFNEAGARRVAELLVEPVRKLLH